MGITLHASALSAATRKTSQKRYGARVEIVALFATRGVNRTSSVSRVDFTRLEQKMNI